MRRRRLAILILVLALLVCGIGGLLIRKPDLLFPVREAFFRLTNSAEWEQVEIHEWSEDLSSARWDQSLLLVSPDHPLKQDYQADVSEYRDSGVWMNPQLHDAYAALAEEVRTRFDQKLLIKSAYRSREEQAQEVQAQSELAADPGESEHETGLCLDVCVPYFGGRSFLKTPAGQYVNLLCWEEGFIIRYPNGKQSVTGIPYEPWHLRYVGQPHAEIIMKSGLTLEEYLNHFEPDTVYRYRDILIGLQRKDNLRVPIGYDVVFSPVCDDLYMMTAFPQP